MGTVKDKEEDRQRGGVNLVLTTKLKVRGTCVVRDKHGAPKYDRPELAGSYNESKGE